MAAIGAEAGLRVRESVDSAASQLGETWGAGAAERAKPEGGAAGGDGPAEREGPWESGVRRGLRRGGAEGGAGLREWAMREGRGSRDGRGR